MGAVTWTAYAAANDLDTTANINSLADGAAVILDEVDNSTDRYQYGDLVIELDAAGPGVTAVGVDARLDVFLIPAVDGTNYPDPPGATAANVTGTYFVGSILSADAVGASAAVVYKRGVLRGIVLPPTKFKFVVANELGATTPSSGNDVKLYRYSETVAAS